MNGLLEAMHKDTIAACHDISEGGLAVCLTEMAIGGDLGATIDIAPLGNLRSDLLLFSESNTRWIVAIHPDNKQDFEKILTKNQAPFAYLGTTTKDTFTITKTKKLLISAPVSSLRDSWKKTLWDYMG
jgi:phosphoribosylformylglycinamidine synthase